MKIVDTRCPSCGSQLQIDLDNRQATCEFCGARLPIDDEIQRMQIDGAEKAGYDFEKGRQRAQAEAAQIASQRIEVNVQQPKKRKTWLWVLGWIFIFPVPLTIIMLHNDKMDKRLRYAVIAVGWLIYLAIAFSAGGSESSNKTATQNASSSSAAAVAASSASEEEINRPKMTTEEFIQAYNASQFSNSDLVAGETFVPSDKNDPHYRTEFRLPAWGSSIGTDCAAGDVSVDIISSSSGLIQRLYAFGPRDQVAEFYRATAHILDAGVNDQEVDEFIQATLDGRSPSGLIDGTGHKHLNTLFQMKPDNMAEAMLERS